MFLKKEFVVNLKKKQQHSIGFPTFKLPSSTEKSFLADPLNIIFDYFGI